MKRYFCTLFDSGYLFKGVVMLQTLRANCDGACVFVLCMDALCQRILGQLGLPGVICIALSEVENADLLAAKKGRNVAGLLGGGRAGRRAGRQGWRGR